jgi:predicted nucleic acid-binding protein
MDERRGRKLAASEGVPVIGLLGIILLAKRKKLIPSARALLTELRDRAGMYLANEIVQDALKTVGE